MNSKKAEELSRQWKEDYRKVIRSEQQKVFSFIPDEGVTTPREFTAALFAYANKNDLDLVMTKESMYPEFTIDGIEYEAERIYSVVHRVPVAIIRCSVRHPEDFEADVPAKRKKVMKLLNLSWLVGLYLLLLLCVIIGWEEMFSSWEGWLLLASFGILIAVSVYCKKLLYFNEKH